MNVLIPLTITEAMLRSGTSIAEPAAGEVVWTSGGTYTVGQYRIRTQTHRVYKCVQDHSARTVPPEDDPAYWQDWDPTQRHAPFDPYTSTATQTTGSITLVLQPGFFNAISLYGMLGTSLSVVVKDSPGGTIIYSQTTDLYEQARGLYELLFSPLRQLTQLARRGIEISPTAELTVTIDSGSGDPVELGMLNIGDFAPLIGETEFRQAQFGGTEYGAAAQPKTYSYIKFDADGTVEIKRRGSATDLRGSCVIPQEQADSAVALIQSVLDKPVSCIATTAQGYDYLNVFGLLSGDATAEGPTHARFDYQVQGMI